MTTYKTNITTLEPYSNDRIAVHISPLLLTKAEAAALLATGSNTSFEINLNISPPEK